ncbi:MAG: ferritin [Lachnospiraceae bacterium]|nr:ferritin [Lachnospiraceae bacterium]
MDKKVYELMNDQINKEFYSAYLYLDMSNWYDAYGLDGFANWFHVQAQEEMDHGMLMYTYLHNNNEKVVLKPIEKPDTDFKEIMDPLYRQLEHEKFVTSLIDNIYAAAQDAKEFRTTQFLDWFIKEQVEEEKNAQDLIDKMNIFADDKRALYMLNQELAARTYAAPSLVLD